MTGILNEERRKQIGYLMFNLVSAIGVTLINKYCFTKVEFGFPTALCNIHYVFSWIGVDVMRRLGMFQPMKVITFDRAFCMTILFLSICPVLNNTSLQLNSVGFAQIFKLLVSPAIVCLEYILDRKTLSMKRTFALLAVFLFVILSSKFTLDFSLKGATVASMWVPLAAGYKVQWGRTQRQKKCSTMALMHATLPYATMIQFLLNPLMDPPGLLSFSWSMEAVFWLSMSGLAAFFVNLSGFLVLGHISGLAHVLLGQFKTSIICLSAFYLFDSKYSKEQIINAVGAITSIIIYTHVTINDKDQNDDRIHTSKDNNQDVERQSQEIPLIQNDSEKQS